MAEWKQRIRDKVLGSQFALRGKLNYLSISIFTYPKGPSPVSDTDWISGLKCRSLMILNSSHKRWNNPTFPSMKKPPLSVWMFCVYAMFWMCILFSNICQIKINLPHKLPIPISVVKCNILWSVIFNNLTSTEFIWGISGNQIFDNFTIYIHSAHNIAISMIFLFLHSLFFVHILSIFKCYFQALLYDTCGSQKIWAYFHID